MATRAWLITGCSSGFGRALAGLLLERGERVIATARNPDTLADLVAPHGDRGMAVRLDITRGEDIAAALAAANARFGEIDVLVNNAGYGAIAVTEDAEPASARALMETNYFGTLAMIQAVLPAMRRRRSGQIVNIGSVAGLIGFPALGNYCASKFAVEGLSESLAKEMKPHGVHVTVVELGPFATEFTRSMQFAMPDAAAYDMAALSVEAGNSHWGAGEDPRLGAAALVAALADPEPPVHLILGQDGLDVVDLHDRRRQAERSRWRGLGTLADAD